VYITANISGGHLNPAVTLATIFTGHISIVKGVAYIFMQITGACFGVLMVVSLWPHQTSTFNLTQQQQQQQQQHQLAFHASVTSLLLFSKIVKQHQHLF